MSDPYKYTFEEIALSSDNGSVKEYAAKSLKKRLTEYFSNGMPRGMPCGIDVLNTYFSWVNGYVYCFSGYPQSGKSEILNWLSVLWIKKTDGKVMMYSPEADKYELVDNLCRLYLGKNTNTQYPLQCTQDEYSSAMDFVNDHYLFVEFDEMPTVKTLIKVYEQAATKGVKMFITDPFNYVAEGSVDDGNGISRYLKTALSAMKTFAKNNEVINIIVEHPTKPYPLQDGTIPKCTVHRINGGAMWNNKMDCIVLMHRDWDSTVVTFEVAKMKSQRHNGVTGECVIIYDPKTGRYK